MRQLSNLTNEIVARSTVFGSDRFVEQLNTDRTKAEKIIAAGVLVVDRIGVEDSAKNTERTIEHVAELLENRGILGWIFTLFGASNPWVMLASILIPLLIDWFRERETNGVCGVGPELASECDQFLRV